MGIPIYLHKSSGEYLMYLSPAFSHYLIFCSLSLSPPGDTESVKKSVKNNKQTIISAIFAGIIVLDPLPFFWE